jgi:hypothetical protein
MNLLHLLPVVSATKERIQNKLVDTHGINFVKISGCEICRNVQFN